jgi:hypothetical protein
MDRKMDFSTIEPADLGRGLRGLGLNLLVRDVRQEATFLAEVLGLTVPRLTADFAIVAHGAQVMMLHSDASYHNHPLPSLLPEAGPRGAGVEIRLYGIDPDAACARLPEWPRASLLQPATDKPHGLREAVILSPEGYAWVPGRAI